MAIKQLATKINGDIKDALEALCEERGFKMNKFIEEAILDKIEELEDIEDLKKLRQEKTRSLSDIIKELKKNGKL